MYKRSRPKVSDSLAYFPLVIFLCGLFSIYLVYNASSIYAYNTFGNSYYFLINQSIWFLFSVFIFYFIQKIKLKYIENISTPLFFLSLFFLFFVLVPTPFSVPVYGARRWLILNPTGILPEIPFLGRLTLQPSELFKLALCLFFPKLILANLSRSQKYLFIKYITYLLVPSFLILIEPDLKDTIIVVAMGISLLFVSNISLKYFVPIVPITFICVVILIVLAPYRFERLKTFMGGGGELETSYHVKQINIALGSGGLFGVGVGKSIQKNEYLPEVMGDSIFAIFGEEFGFVGGVILISLLFFILYLIFRIITNLNTIFYKLTATGVFCWFAVQSLMNLGSISGIFPLTGVPLPLISYGGSSFIFTIIGLAIIYRFYKEDQKRV